MNGVLHGECFLENEAMMSGEPIKVLLIKDDLSDAGFLQEMLQREAIAFDWQKTPCGGLECAATGAFNVILLDARLTDAGGLDTVSAVCNGAHGIPVIVVSSRSEDATIADALRCGAQDYLVKGKFDQDTLRCSIRYAIQRTSLELIFGAERFRSVFEEAPIGVCVTDLDNKIVQANKTMCGILGCSKEDILMRKFDVLLSNGCVGAREFLASKSSNAVTKFEQSLIRKSGPPICTNISGMILLDKLDRPTNKLLMIQDISSEKRLEQEISYLAAIVQSSEDAIIGKFLDGTIYSWNDGARRLFGYESGEVIGRSISILAPPEASQEIPLILEKLKRGEHVQPLETRRMTKDGRIIDVSLRISAIKDSCGKIIGAAAIERDITERKRIMDNERKMRLMRQREDFMAALSHDLKNPLIGMSRILELFVSGYLGSLTAEQKEILLELDQSNKSLLSLVQNLLDVYRYEKDVSSLTFADTDLNDLIKTCVCLFEHIANDRGIRLSILLPDEPVMVRADAPSIRRVVQNLVDNALKFTPRHGQIEVRLGSNASLATVEVQDTGPGISVNDRMRLFERFWQGPPGKKYAPGTGLGLYLCHEIMVAHHGSISCRSQIGHGSTFSIQLPVSSAVKQPTCASGEEVSAA